jgi:type I restriction enzyme S subunit
MAGKVFQLNQLGKVVTGKTPKTADRGNFGGDIPFVTPKDFDGRRIISDTERYLSEKGMQNVGGSFIPARSVMVTCIGSDMGKVAIAGKDSVTNQQINSLIINPPNIPEYIYYNLSARRSELRISAAGSAQPILNKSDFGALEIELPAVSTQRETADILGSLDDKIELNRRMNETLEAMARAIFKSWFVDFDPVRAKSEGRDTGLPKEIADIFPSEFVESELGKIPKGWKVRSVNDVGQVICGKTPPTQVSDYYGDDMPFITIPDMHGKVFVTKSQKQLSNAGAISQHKKMLPAGAICVSCIATTGLVVITSQESQTNQQINSVIPSETDQTYFWFCTFRNLGDEIKAAGSGGSVLANLNTGHFAEMRVLAPPTKLRCFYHFHLMPLFDRIMSNEKETNTLNVLRDSLLPKLMSGEIVLSE